jgi:integrase
MNLDQIKNATTPGTILWDKGSPQSVKGLHFRVRENSSRAYYMYYRTKTGTQRRPKLGDFGEITLADARKLAKDIALKVKAGEDPGGSLAAAKAELTLSDLYQLVVNDHWSAKRYQESAHASKVDGLWKKHLKPIFGAKKLSDLLPREGEQPPLIAWHKSLSENIYAANRSLEILSVMYNWAIANGRFKGNNPCQFVKAYTEKKRKRFPRPDEMRAIGAALEKLKPFYFEEYVYIVSLFLTGSRPVALLEALWEEVEIVTKNSERYGIFTFFGKTTADSGEEEVLVIPPRALTLMEELRPEKTGRIFRLKRTPTGFWHKVVREARCFDVWMRDARRAFATYADDVNDRVIQELLNHKSADTTRRYARVREDKRIEAVAAIASRVEGLLGGGGK